MAKRSTAASAARDEGLSRVEINTREWWKLRAWDAILHLPAGEMTGEDIRLAVIEQVGEPHHHNIWGSLISRAIKDNVIQDTGSRTPMQTEQSHARSTAIYSVGQMREDSHAE